MEKYGVLQEEPEKTKTSADNHRCRSCGEVLRPASDVGVKLCPKCGTAPYEVRK